MFFYIISVLRKPTAGQLLNFLKERRVTEKNLDLFIPKFERDFTEYAELIAHRFKPYEKSYHHILLLKAVMRLSVTNMKAAYIKDVASSVTTITNGKGGERSCCWQKQDEYVLDSLSWFYAEFCLSSIHASAFGFGFGL